MKDYIIKNFQLNKILLNSIDQTPKAFKSTDRYKDDPTILKYTEEGNYDNKSSNNSLSNSLSQVNKFQTNDSLSKNPEVKRNKVRSTN